MIQLNSCSTSKPFARKNLQRIVCDTLQHDTIIYVNQLKIVDDRLLCLFDSIIDMKNTCVYKNEDVWFHLTISQRDTNSYFLMLSGNQHDERSKCSIMSLDIQGLLYYRNYPFIVSIIREDTSIVENNPFYVKNGYVDSLRVPYVNHTLFTAYLKDVGFYHEMNIWYDFMFDGQEYLPYGKNCQCIGYFPIYYKMKKRDNIESVSRKFQVSSNMIMKLNNMGDPSVSKQKIQVQ